MTTICGIGVGAAPVSTPAASISSIPLCCISSPISLALHLCWGPTPCIIRGYTPAGVKTNRGLLRLPTELVDYVICHELAHVRIPGHGKGWQALMSIHVPDWREREMRLAATPGPRFALRSGLDRHLGHAAWRRPGQRSTMEAFA